MTGMRNAIAEHVPCRMHTYLQYENSCTGLCKSNSQLGSPVGVVVEHVETVQQHIAGPQDLKATNHNTVDPTADMECISTSASECVINYFACKCRQVPLLQSCTTAHANHSADCGAHSSAAEPHHAGLSAEGPLHNGALDPHV